MLQVGDRVPDFSVSDQDGQTVRWADFSGRWVALYFYPRDMTPGCTQEACSFRDQHAALAAQGVVVLGVSPDTVGSHRKFADKHGLPFRLLADPDHQLAEAYGVWGEKKLYGRTFMGLLRTTFLIAPDGRIQQVWKKPKVAVHADEVLAAFAG